MKITYHIKQNKQGYLVIKQIEDTNLLIQSVVYKQLSFTEAKFIKENLTKGKI